MNTPEDLRINDYDKLKRIYDYCSEVYAGGHLVVTKINKGNSCLECFEPLAACICEK